MKDTDKTKGKFINEMQELHQQIVRLEVSELERKWMEETLRRVNRALKTLSACNKTLVGATDESEFIGEVCRIIVEIGGYRLAWVGIAEHDRKKTVRPVGQWGYEAGYLATVNITWAETDRGRGPTGTSIRTGSPNVVQHILTNPDYEPWRAEALKRGYASSIALPLLAGGKPFGALNIYAVEPDGFDTEEVHLLMELAENLSYGIITLRSRAEHKRTEQDHSRLAVVIEQVAEGVVVTDTEGIIQYVNPAFEQMSGYTNEEIIGKQSDIFKNGKNDKEFYTRIHDTLGRGEVWRSHLSKTRKDGTLYELEVTVSPVRDRIGAIINYVAIERDVTHEVRLEQQLRQAQKMQAIGTLAGGIAHDFNNILMPIIINTELILLNIPEESPARYYLEQTLEAAHRGKELVKQIIAFSRHSKPDRKPIQINPIVKETIKLLRVVLPPTIELRQTIEPELGMVLADPTQIHQVVLNLCTNAAHAMRDKGGMLEVNLGTVELDHATVAQFPDLEPGNYLKLTVSDTGHGMEPAVMEWIFDPFFTTKRPGEGTGMGLAVVHGIVESYGGAVTASSELGKGSTFTVLLPLVEADTTSEASSLAPIPTGNERILFADDDETIIRSVKLMLENLGYTVIATNNSIEALEIFRAQPDTFDLVIADQVMPNMTGTELVKAIGRIRPDIPIILCTGFSDVITKEEITVGGVHEFVMKPFTTREMAEVIRRALDKKTSLTL